MEIVVKPRGGGKTTALLNWLVQQPAGAAVIVQNAATAVYIKNLLEDRGVPKDKYRIILGEQARSNLRNLDVPVAVDDIDRFFSQLFGRRPDFVTISDH